LTQARDGLREDWWRVWRRIKPVFADCDPKTVTLEDISAWRTHAHAALANSSVMGAKALQLQNEIGTEL
jgi:hypothetical protein